jgi:hypothetical protein
VQLVISTGQLQLKAAQNNNTTQWIQRREQCSGIARVLLSWALRAAGITGALICRGYSNLAACRLF